MHFYYQQNQTNVLANARYYFDKSTSFNPAIYEFGQCN